jgi:hypothetical protein
MSLVLNALPDIRTQLDSLQRAAYEKNLRIADLEQQLAHERAKVEALERVMENLRETLRPLYTGLSGIFQQIDLAAPARPVASQAVWDSWKQKLGGLTAKAIDVLLLHGPMNQTQLRIQLHCATRSVTNIVGALNKAGLITKADGRIALREI